MSLQKKIISGVVFLIAVGLGILAWKKYGETTPAPAQAVTTPPPAESSGSPAPQYPLESEKDSKAGSSPSQQEAPEVSNESFITLMSGFTGPELVEKIFQKENLLDRLVMTLESLPYKQLASEYLAFNSPDTAFTVTKTAEEIQISVENFARYQPYIDFLQKIDSKDVVSIYQKYYPVLQKKYLDLGTGPYLNDRTIQVINNLLATPNVTYPLAVYQIIPGGSYHFKDEALENLNPGQKILVRMGPKNMKIVKTKLHEIRELLIQKSKKPKH